MELKWGKRDRLQRGFLRFRDGWGEPRKKLKVEKMEVSEDQRTTNVLLVEYMKGENTDNMAFALPRNL